MTDGLATLIRDQPTVEAMVAARVERLSRMRLIGGALSVRRYFLPLYSSLPCAASQVSIDNVISAQALTCEPNICPGKYFQEVAPAPPIMSIRPVRQPRIDQPVYVLQDWFDSVLPGASLVDNMYDQEMVEYSDYSAIVHDMTLDKTRMGLRPRRYDKLRPVLRTPIYPDRRDSQRESINGMLKRNLNVPSLHGLIDHERDCADILNNFISTYVPKHNQPTLRRMTGDIVYPNLDDMNDWLRTQPPFTRTNVASDLSLWEQELNTYSFMIKKNSKPVLDRADLNTYPSLQTIVYHEKWVNLVFCPIFRELKSRLIGLLDPRFQIFTDVSPSEFSRKLSALYPARTLRRLFKKEVDISKFDKSQAQLLLAFECELYTLLGMHPYFVSLWRTAHTHTVLRDRRNGLKLKIDYQRKSGDASTFFGNTVVLMAMLATVYNLRLAELAVFSGDDSLIFSERELEGSEHLFALLFNMEAKLLNYDHPYFCSKFLICVDDHWRFIPDPLKVVSKLGRKDLANFDHCREYYVSICDLMAEYRDATINFEFFFSFLLPLNART